MSERKRPRGRSQWFALPAALGLLAMIIALVRAIMLSASSKTDGLTAPLLASIVVTALILPLVVFLLLQFRQIRKALHTPALPWGDPAGLILIRPRQGTRGMYLSVLGFKNTSMARNPLVLQATETGLIFWDWRPHPPARVAFAPWSSFGGMWVIDDPIRGTPSKGVAIFLGGVTLNVTLMWERPDGKMRTLTDDDGVARVARRWAEIRGSRR